MSSSVDIVIIGGGIIGLACARRLTAAGRSVALCDPDPGGGATHAAAGMLAPVAEARWGDERLLPLALASIRRWPAFADELSDETGIDLDLHSNGILIAGIDSDDKAVLDDLLVLHAGNDLEASALSSRDTRTIEPALTPGLRSGVLALSDMAIDPRRVVGALLASLERAGTRVERQMVMSVEVSGGRVTAVVLRDGTRLAAGSTVVAAGAMSGAIGGLPERVLPPVRPVKGQILRLRGERLLRRPVHGFVHGNPVYLVPRSDGELVVGATQEEMGFDARVTGRGVYELLRDAITLVPDVGELDVREMTVGFRPGTPDNLPLIGSSDIEGLMMATGHHRNGILLAPVTADIIGEAVATGRIASEFLPYSPTWPVRKAPVVIPT